MDRDVDEASVLHCGLELGRFEAKIDASGKGAAGEQGAPLLDCAVRGKGVVVREGDEVEFLRFNVAAGFDYSISS